jgi:hypothetical protein
LILTRWSALILLAAASAASPARAEVGVEIVQYGVFQADIVSKRPDPSGVARNVVDNVCHISTTRTVPLRIGLHFGVRYKVDGPIAGEPVVLRKVLVYPRPMAPPPVRPRSMIADTVILPVGTVSYTDYAFEAPWELVAGTWSFQFFQNERKLAEVNFEAVEDKDIPLPPAAESTCFQVS